MGTPLTNQPIKDTYPDLVNFGSGGEGATGSLQTLCDGLGNALPIQVSTSGVALSGAVSIGSGTGVLTVSGGSIVVVDPSSVGVPLSNTSPWTAPQPLNKGYSISQVNPTLGSTGSRSAANYFISYDGTNINTGFSDGSLSDSTFIVTHGDYVYAGGTNNKTTYYRDLVVYKGYGSGQRFVFGHTVFAHGMGDSAQGSVVVESAAGPIAGDEGTGLWLVSYLRQPSSLALSTVSPIFQTTDTSLTTTTNTIVGDAFTPQTITLASVSGLSVGTWIMVGVGPESGTPNHESVILTAVSGSTVTGIFRNNHSGTTRVGKCLVMQYNGDGEGQGRTLVNLSQSPYTTGTITGSTGGSLQGSGMTWTKGMVGGSDYNYGAISVTADNYTVFPFDVTPARWWYMITDVFSTTSLGIHSFSIAGDVSYRGTASGPYIIRPAVRILRVIYTSTPGQGPCTLVCEPTASTWNSTDNVEVAMCPFPDVFGYDIRLEFYAPGGNYRNFYSVTNPTGVEWSGGFVVNGNFISAFRTVNCQWGMEVFSAQEGALRLGSTDSGGTDLSGRIQWGGRYLQPNSSFAGTEFQVCSNSASGKDGTLRSAGTAYTSDDQSWLQFVGVFGVSGNGNAVTDGCFRFWTDDGGHTFPLAHSIDFQHRVFTDSLVFGDVVSLDVIDRDTGFVPMAIRGTGVYVKSLFLDGGLSGTPFLPNSSLPPTWGGATGTKGEVRYDSTSRYECIATDTWRQSASTNSFGSVIAYDNFATSHANINGQSLVVGGTWSVDGGAASSSGGVLVATSGSGGGGLGDLLLSTNTGQASCSVSANFVIQSVSLDACIMFRESDANNWWIFQAFTDNTLNVYKVEASSAVLINTTSQSIPIGTSFTLKVVLSGDNMTFFYNGTHAAALDTTNTFNNTAVKHGVRLGVTNTADEFSVSNP